MLNIQREIINYNSSARSIQPQWIVIHDTGDAGATAKNEHDYFSGGDRQASADYFVDSNNIIQIIDTDNRYSWAIGDGGGRLGKTNSNSCSIEMCIESNGQPTEATIQNTLDLTKYLMNKYGLDASHVVRHYDCSYKNCPASFNTDGNWNKWSEFKNRLVNSSSRKLGWNQNSTGWWYCTDVTNGYYYKDEWKQIDGEWYSFDNQGYARKSVWLKDKLWYYLKDSCKMAKLEWLWIDGECYCFDKSGALYVNCTTPDGYKVDNSGAWIH